MDFSMASTEFEKERKGKERRKIKVISSQIMLNHHTCVIQRGRGRQNESNDAVELWLQLPEPAARASQKVVERLTRMRHVSIVVLFYIFFVKKLKISFGLNNINKQIMVKLQPSS